MIQRITSNEFHINYLECNPWKPPQIWEYPISQKDEIRKAFLKWGAYQIQLWNYPFSREKHPRRFQSTWFKMFPSLLEYSPTSDRSYVCHVIYLVKSQLVVLGHMCLLKRMMEKV